MSASVICVDLSSESEEEQSPPGAKRRRLEDPLRPVAMVATTTTSGRPSLPAKLVNIPKASLGTMTGQTAAAKPPLLPSLPTTDPLQSMHIPSGITVTKHQKNNTITNGNITITIAENNNNNTHSYNNNMKAKQVKMGAAQKVAWTMSNKAPSPNALITSVPSHQVKVTPSTQYWLASVGKAPTPATPGVVVPKAVPAAKIQPPVGIGQQQQQPSQQQKPLVISSAKAKAPMGQMLQQLQQQQKALSGQLQQHQQQQQPQPKGIVQQRVSLGQQQPPPQQQPQQQKPFGVQLHQQPKPLPQKMAVGAQNQQQPKSIMGQQPAKSIQVQVQQQPSAPKIAQVQIQPQAQPAKIGMAQQVKKAQQQQQVAKAPQPQQQVAKAQQQQQQQQVAKAQQQQLVPKPPMVQPNRAAFEQLQQQQQYRAYLGQLQQQQQQQRAPAAQAQVLMPQLNTNVGPVQVQPLVPLTQQQQQPQPRKSTAKPPPTANHQQKTQMAQQLQKAVMEQQSPGQPQLSPFIPKPVLPSVNQITHKSMTIQKLPMLQPRASAKVTSKAAAKQIIQPQPQLTPPPAHLVQKLNPPPPGMLPNPAYSHKVTSPVVRPKITASQPNSRATNFQVRPPGPAITTTAAPMGMSAARTLPFRSTLHKPVTPPPPPLTARDLQGFTTSATPPQRLLATPPHCAAALNEPLLLNLPPTTSITPQLTPTTTPPPTAIPAAVQHQQLAKAAAFKLNSLPGASISPVTRPASAKRIQPITVLKKSDEEWRRHMFEQQQQQQQQQQKQREQLQPTSTPTIVLVESPPTTPPTDKVEPESKTASSGVKPAQQANKVPTPLKIPSIDLDPEVVDLDALPESPPPKRQPAAEKVATPKEKAKPKAASPPAKAPFTPEYAALLKLCLEVDKSADMERLAQGKLTKYYYSVHESFVKSRGFRKFVETAISRIKNESDMVYVHIKSVVDELKARRVAKVRERSKPLARDSPAPSTSTPKKQKMQDEGAEEQEAEVEEVAAEEEQEEEEVVSEPASPTLDKRKDERIRKLNRTLATIKKRIEMLEEADVDLNDDDSSYLQVERFKKRACQIYEKICDLTGESKSASRQLKQAIIFKDSPYPYFNRTLSAFVNKMQQFPDYNDVVQLLEHCNKEKELGLANFEMKTIAYDAFTKVGKLLQARRKTDLYETVTHFTANIKDPAASDPQLLAKLEENNKKQTKISDVLEKFAREQDLNTEERQEARLKLKRERAAEEAAKLAALAEDDDKPCTSAQAAAKAAAAAALMNGSAKAHQKADGATLAKDNDEEDGGEVSEDETESEDDEEEDDVDAYVDNFRVNGEVSDAESEADAAEVEAVPEPEPEDVIDITRTETAAEKDDDEGPPNGKLKIISVSSLNANFVHEQQPKPNNPKPSEKPVIAAEIVISDEEP